MTDRTTETWHIIFRCNRHRDDAGKRQPVLARVTYRVEIEAWLTGENGPPQFRRYERKRTMYVGDRKVLRVARDCDACGKPMAHEQIRGRYSEARECDARCMGAIGPSCDCQCGGANHGGKYDVSA